MKWHLNGDAVPISCLHMFVQLSILYQNKVYPYGWTTPIVGCAFLYLLEICAFRFFEKKRKNPKQTWKQGQYLLITVPHYQACLWTSWVPGDDSVLGYSYPCVKAQTELMKGTRAAVQDSSHNLSGTVRDPWTASVTHKDDKLLLNCQCRSQ